MSPDIQKFFESYRDAFNALDSEEIARLYFVPSGIVTNEGYSHWESYACIQDNMESLCNKYRENGYLEASFETLALMEQSAKFVVADLKWNIKLKEDATWSFRTAYNLIKTREAWQVLLVTAYEE